MPAFSPCSSASSRHSSRTGHPAHTASRGARRVLAAPREERRGTLAAARGVGVPRRPELLDAQRVGRIAPGHQREELRERHIG